MTNDTHARARGLIRKAWIEELAAAENEWLQAHLRDCAECAQAAGSTQAMISELRAAPVMADARLVELTRAKVMLRAQQLRDAQERRSVMTVACLASFISGGITLPLMWKLFAWLGTEVSLAEPVWQAGFAMFVVLPGVLGALALLTRRRTADFVHLRGAGE